jgi:predicted Zn finger-like uncharacterized protein
MPVTVSCTECQTIHRLADSLQGKKVRCKSCSQIIVVPRTPSIGDGSTEQIVEAKPVAAPAQTVPIGVTPPTDQRSRCKRTAPQDRGAGAANQ